MSLWNDFMCTEIFYFDRRNAGWHLLFYKGLAIAAACSTTIAQAIHGHGVRPACARDLVTARDPCVPRKHVPNEFAGIHDQGTQCKRMHTPSHCGVTLTDEPHTGMPEQRVITPTETMQDKHDPD